MTTKEIKYGVCVFKNIDGVTCYMNSIIAIIQQTPIFTDYILTAKFKDVLLLKMPIDKLHKSILFNLYNLIYLSHTHDHATINPLLFRQSLIRENKMWGKKQHQDSQELMTFMFNKIEEEISQKVIFIPGKIIKDIILSEHDNIISLMAINMWQQFIKNEYSIIKNLFGGMTHINITCSCCKTISHNFDIFQILQLSIPNKQKTIYDCLDEFIKKEKIDKENKILCEFCGLKNQSIKQTLLWKTPKILIIQFKRFITDDYGEISGKLTDMIEYPVENLDITKYINPISPDINKSKYNLYAVNCHRSLNKKSIDFGHYTSIIKNRFDDKWYIADDSDDLEEVKIEDVVNTNAYMLFYKN